MSDSSRSPLPARSFPIKAASIKREEVPAIEGRMGNGTFFSCSFQSWHAYFTLAATQRAMLGEPTPFFFLYFFFLRCGWKETSSVCVLNKNQNQRETSKFRARSANLTLTSDSSNQASTGQEIGFSRASCVRRLWLHPISSRPQRTKIRLISKKWRGNCPFHKKRKEPRMKGQMGFPPENLLSPAVGVLRQTTSSPPCFYLKKKVKRYKILEMHE